MGSKKIHLLSLLSLGLCLGIILSAPTNVSNDDELASGSGNDGGEDAYITKRGKQKSTKISTRGTCPDRHDIPSFLCAAGKLLIEQLPGGDAATAFLDQMFTTGDQTKEEAWLKIQGHTRKYIKDVIEGEAAREIDDAHEELVRNVATCKRRQDRAEKADCYKRLVLRMHGILPQFQGDVNKVKATKFSYFEMFVATYWAVLKRAYDLGSSTVKNEMKIEVKPNARDFYNYIMEAKTATEIYGCRHLIMRIERMSSAGPWVQVHEAGPDEFVLHDEGKCNKHENSYQWYRGTAYDTSDGGQRKIGQGGYKCENAAAAISKFTQPIDTTDNSKMKWVEVMYIKELKKCRSVLEKKFMSLKKDQIDLLKQLKEGHGIDAFLSG